MKNPFKIPYRVSPHPKAADHVYLTMSWRTWGRTLAISTVLYGIAGAVAYAVVKADDIADAVEELKEKHLPENS